MIVNGTNIDIKDFQKGIQMILEAFNEQKKQYLNIINSMNEKMILLEQQVSKLKEENAFYQNKLHTLQKNIKCISKSICQLKDDEILNNDVINDNNDNIVKNPITNKFDKDNYLKIIMDKNKDLLNIHNLNKLENQKTKNKNHKNKYINELNYYTGEQDISIIKKDKIYKKAINKILNIDSIKNKTDSISIKKKDMNSTEASLQIAQLFYDLLKDQTIKNKYKNNPTALILLVQKLGQTFIDIDPVQFCIGNTIKKILHIIREEIRENQKDKNNNSNETKESLSNTVNQENKKLLDIKNLEYTDSDNTTEKSFNSSGQLYEVKKEESNDELNMDVILENIDTLIAEMSSISETITEKKEIKDLISDNDIILTTNYSEQIVKILSENKRTKKFKVFVCESAPKLREKSMSEELKKIKLDVTTVENDDIYSVMKKYTKVKVFLGAKAILNNGGLIAYGGSYNICLLASMFSNPVIIAAGATKLTPMYSFKHEFYNEYLSPDLIFGKNMNYNGDISNIQFNTPSLDYIPPNLISMYATDIGILNPKFLYKNFNEMYDLEDYEI